MADRFGYGEIGLDINPCRGCEDYDARDGCKSNGGCGKPITNYDRIVSQKPEELADFLWSIGNNPATGNYYLNGKLLFFGGDGNGWLDWLKQEAGE